MADNFLRNTWITTQDLGAIFEEGGSPWAGDLVSIELLDANDGDALVASASYETAQPSSAGGVTGDRAVVKIPGLSGSFKMRLTAPDSAQAVSAAFDVGAREPWNIVSDPANMRTLSAAHSSMWADAEKTSPLSAASSTPQDILVLADAGGQGTPDLVARDEANPPQLVLRNGVPFIRLRAGFVHAVDGTPWVPGNPINGTAYEFFSYWRPSGHTGTLFSSTSPEWGQVHLGTTTLSATAKSSSTVEAAFPIPDDGGAHSVLLPHPRFNHLLPRVDGAEVAWSTVPDVYNETRTRASIGYLSRVEDSDWFDDSEDAGLYAWTVYSPGGGNDPLSDEEKTEIDAWISEQMQ